MVQAHRLDGVVTLSNCDKITPGMLMAAARLDVPAISVTVDPWSQDSTRERKSVWTACSKP